jgi:MOSC domain-containing protein
MRAGSQLLGSVQSLWLYPVKSMQGAPTEDATLTERGLRGDRAYGLIDLADGTVASAKNPRKWPGLLDCRAEYAGPVSPGVPLAVRITLPDGSVVTSDHPDVHGLLSGALGRAVELRSSAPAAPTLEQLLLGEAEGRVIRERMPDGTFFDLGMVHLLMTSTLERLRAVCPDSDFHVRRFRPNIVIAASDEHTDLGEPALLGRTLRLGESARVGVAAPALRCVMTTLCQPGLAADAATLRAVVRHAGGSVGAYAEVIQGGAVRAGDPVWLEGD